MDGLGAMLLLLLGAVDAPDYMPVVIMWVSQPQEPPSPGP